MAWGLGIKGVAAHALGWLVVKVDKARYMAPVTSDVNDWRRFGAISGSLQILLGVDGAQIAGFVEGFDSKDQPAANDRPARNAKNLKIALDVLPLVIFELYSELTKMCANPSNNPQESFECTSVLTTVICPCVPYMTVCVQNLGSEKDRPEVNPGFEESAVSNECVCYRV